MAIENKISYIEDDNQLLPSPQLPSPTSGNGKIITIFSFITKVSFNYSDSHTDTNYMTITKTIFFSRLVSDDSGNLE